MGIDVWRMRTAGAAARPSNVTSDPRARTRADAVRDVAMPRAGAPAQTSPRATPVARETGKPSVLTPAAERGDIAHMAWDELAKVVSVCRACALHAGRTQTVFGVGDRSADWLFIGEAPGAEEDRQGEPFVGRAGQLLNSMLFAIGTSRDKVYIANILKCRPPNNRDPQPEESRCCRPFLDRQIALIAPRIIVALGRIAAQQLLQTDTPIGRLRGRVHQHTVDDRRIPVVVTYHPAYLLRSPQEKIKAWTDLQLAREAAAGAVT
jgi:uracil-DNA glycosylase family 4